MGRKAVLFVFDEPAGGTRYRCGHQAEELGILGVSSDTVQSGRVDLAAAIDHYECFVLYRVQWSDEVAAFVDQARSRDKLVVFDTDDLVFEPGLTHFLAFLDTWSEEDRRGQIDRFDGYRKTLEACGSAIVSTEPLGDHARRHVDRVGVVFNAVSQDMVRRADQALASRSTRSSAGRELTIAYLSGTRTHDRDFLEAADAVLWALDSYPETRFLAVGKLELDARFDGWGSRVSRSPLQSWEALPELLSTVDVNLAPLERNNPVAECKSCVKYLEAGLLGVPTVASARPDFVRVIQHGRNGFLADSPAEWSDSLRRLIESAQLRNEIGASASEDVRRSHTTSARAKSLGEALGSLGLTSGTVRT